MSTLQDIANRVGVSHATVSRVLNSTTEYKRPSYARRAAKIRKIAAELGYRPNTAARATVSGRFDTISLLISDMDYRSTMPRGLLQGIFRELEVAGIRLDLACLSDETLTNETKLPRVLAEHCSDGLLVNYHAAIPESMRALLESAEVPAVWLNVKRDSNAVHPDDRGAGALVTRHLLQRGHRRIAYMDLNYEISRRAGVQHYSKPDRLDGYRDAMREAGLEPTIIFDGDRADDPFAEGMVEHLFERHPDVTAVVVYSDHEFGMLAKIGARRGVLIPDHLSVASFGPRHDSLVYRVTRAVLPESEMGAAAVRMLLSRINHGGADESPRSIPFDFEEGETLLPPLNAKE